MLHGAQGEALSRADRACHVAGRRTGRVTAPTGLSLAEIGRAFDEHRLSARELTEAAIANHARWDAKLHAYSLWTPDIARTMAQRADDALAAGRRLGPLHGV